MIDNLSIQLAVEIPWMVFTSGRLQTVMDELRQVATRLELHGVCVASPTQALSVVVPGEGPPAPLPGAPVPGAPADPWDRFVGALSPGLRAVVAAVAAKETVGVGALGAELGVGHAALMQRLYELRRKAAGAGVRVRVVVEHRADEDLVRWAPQGVSDQLAVVPRPRKKRGGNGRVAGRGTRAKLVSHVKDLGDIFVAQAASLFGTTEHGIRQAVVSSRKGPFPLTIDEGPGVTPVVRHLTDKDADASAS